MIEKIEIFFSEANPPGRIKRWFPFVFLGAVTGILFGKYLGFNNSLIISAPGQDGSSVFLWLEQYGFGELKRGHLALWNPQLFCGSPFFGGFQAGLLYPLNFLYLVCPLPLAMNLSLALHVFLGGVFTYLWLSSRQSHLLSALAGALMFMLGGSFFLHVLPGHFSPLCAMAWIPLILTALDRYRETLKFSWLLTGVFAVAMQVLAGYPQIVYYTALAAGLFALATLGQTENKIRFLVGSAALYTGGAALSAVQLAAGLSAVGESTRGQDVSLALARTNDLQPEALWNWLMPHFYGSWLTHDYWGQGIYWENGFFIGVTGFVMACYGLFASKHRQKISLSALILFLIVLACSRTFLFNWACRFLPLFSHFRGAVKFNILISFFMIALAAPGLDLVFRGEKTSKSFLQGLGLAAGIFLGLALLSYGAPRLGWIRLFHGYDSHADSMARSFGTAGGTLGLLLGLLTLSRSKPLLRYGLFLVLLFELLSFAHANLNSFDSKPLAAKVSAINDWYRRVPGDYRFLVVPQAANYALAAEGADLYGYNPMVPSRFSKFLAATQGLESIETDRPDFRFFPKVLGLTRLRYLFHEKEDGFSVERVGLEEMPRAFLAGQWEVSPPGEILPRVLDPNFDFKNKVWLESEAGINEAPGKLVSRLLITDRSPEVVEVQASLSKPAIFVLTDNYSRDWRVRSQSSSSQTFYEVMPADGFLRAVPLAAGDHHFFLEYRPKFFPAGLGISLASLWLFLILWKREYYKYLRQKKESYRR